MINLKYIPITENTKDSNNFMKCYIKYDLGGYNYFTYQPKERGYYLHIIPIESHGNFEKYTGFTGYCYLLKTCDRKSKKAEAEAIKIAADYEKMIIETLCKENNYKIEVLKNEL